MLQPTDWSREPQSWIGAMPEQRRKLYEIVWNSAIACTMVAPILLHTRSVFGHGNLQLAMHAIMPDPARMGYWRFRQDYPAFDFPLQQNSSSDVYETGPVPLSSLRSRPPVRVRRVWVWQAGVPTMGRVLHAMAENGIGTPASTASLLHGLLLQDSPQQRLLEMQTRGDGALVVSITPYGQQRLARWKANGLIPDTAQAQRQIAAIAHGDVRATDAVRALFRADDPMAEGAARYIEATCARWRGVGQQEGLRALERGRAQPPRFSDLPTWIDPERQLPEDHPLRTLRLTMEQDLAASRPGWAAFDPNDQARARLAWLVEHRADYAAILPPLDGEDARFSALRFWLTGLREGQA
ncbi:MAG: hypothetical protein ACYCSN_18685 [Acidobacteriaceae bacterium]